MLIHSKKVLYEPWQLVALKFPPSGTITRVILTDNLGFKPSIYILT